MLEDDSKSEFSSLSQTDFEEETLTGSFEGKEEQNALPQEAAMTKFMFRSDFPLFLTNRLSLAVLIGLNRFSFM